MDLTRDDFELFDLPRRFAQERLQIDARWRTLQAEVHPDRFAAAGAAAQRVALQYAVRVNEAYQRLKDPLKRAAYLCELAGHGIDAEDNTAMPAAFLMQQMAWREALDEADGLEAIQGLAAQVTHARRDALATLQHVLDERHDAATAAQTVRALMFIERFGADIEHRLEALES